MTFIYAAALHKNEQVISLMNSARDAAGITAADELTVTTETHEYESGRLRSWGVVVFHKGEEILKTTNLSMSSPKSLTSAGNSRKIRKACKLAKYLTK